MSAARPVRISRRPSPSGPGATPPAHAEPIPAPPVGRAPTERRQNAGATRRAVRLSIAYAVALAVVYVALVVSSSTGPAGGTSGSSGELQIVGLVAVAVAAAGAVVTFGAAPRAVEVGEGATIVIGRFGHRYRFPGRAALTMRVLQRFPAGFWSPVPLESVEIDGGTSRRAFLVDEGLLRPSAGPDGPGT